MSEEREPGRASNSRSENDADSEAGSGREESSLFTSHKVSKLDTLAGLAIKYNVTVSDIKRANGLLSDQAMFARDTLLIPKKTLPLDEESAFKVAQMVSSHARGISNLNPGARSKPGSAAFSATGVGGEPGRYDQLVRGSDFPGSPDAAPFCAPPSSIELQARAPPPAAPPKYAGDKKGPSNDDRLNRRGRRDAGGDAHSAAGDGDDMGGAAEGSGAASSAYIPSGIPPPRPSLFSAQPAPQTSIKGFFGAKTSTSSGAAAASPSSSGIAGTMESMFNKIKRAASTPALAPGAPGGPSLVDVGSAIASSLGGGVAASSGSPRNSARGLARTSGGPVGKVGGSKQD